METIVRENMPEDLGEEVVKSTAAETEEAKYAGLENLDVGSKFKMFEKGEEDQTRTRSSDRYGILDKLKRLQVLIVICRPVEESLNTSYPFVLQRMGRI